MFKTISMLQHFFKLPLSSFCDIETSFNETTLVAREGQMMTMLRLNGATSVSGEGEFRPFIERLRDDLAPFLAAPGTILELTITDNPYGISKHISENQRPARLSASRIGLDLENILDEQRDILTNLCSLERVYLGIWTTTAALTEQELTVAYQAKAGQYWPPIEGTQNPTLGLPVLATRHQSKVETLITRLAAQKISAERLSCHEAIEAMKAELNPNHTLGTWRPLLPGDQLRPHAEPIGEAPTSKDDLSSILWPAIADQLHDHDAETETRNTIRYRGQLYRTLDLTLWPTEPRRFEHILRALRSDRVPYRIKFMIEGGRVDQSQSTRLTIAKILEKTNDTNRRVKEGLEYLRELAKTEPLVFARATITTWSRNMATLDMQEAAIISAFATWADTHLEAVAHDPVAAFSGTIPGMSPRMTASKLPARLGDILHLLPWVRPASPWATGPLLFRSPDGKLWPMEPGSSQQHYWFTVAYAVPGSGKSVLMSETALATCLRPGLTELSRIAILDIGPSSAGLIELLKEALPPSRQHEATHITLRMLPEYAINPFDTPLGLREPLPEHKISVAAILGTLAPVENEAAMGQLLALVIDETYRWRSDEGTNAEPHEYTRGQVPDVDTALHDHLVELPERPLWWDVVDALFKAGDHNAAALAQRYAMPTLADTVRAVAEPHIQNIFRDTSVGGGSNERIIDAFVRSISAANSKYKILQGATQFAIAETTRVCAIDLGQVATEGDQAADEQACVAYLLARHALTAKWWVDDAVLTTAPQQYRGYYASYMLKAKEELKSVYYDEFHRTKNVPFARRRIIRDGREGRKHNLQVFIASQVLEDFIARDGEDSIIQYATAKYILGNNADEVANAATIKQFGLPESAADILRRRLTGPGPAGTPMLGLFSTKGGGAVVQHLMLSLGPMKIWALSTTAEDAGLRHRVVQALGTKIALIWLAKMYPRGSAKMEFERRALQQSQRGHDDVAENILQTMASEVISAYVQSLSGGRDDAGKR